MDEDRFEALEQTVTELRSKLEKCEEDIRDLKSDINTISEGEIPGGYTEI